MGKVIDSLSEKWHEWDIELFFYQGIREYAKGRDDRIAVNLCLIVFCLARNLWLAASYIAAALLIAVVEAIHE